MRKRGAHGTKRKDTLEFDMRSVAPANTQYNKQMRMQQEQQ